MPVKLEWHPSLPVLVATYSGVLSGDDYKSMHTQRSAMLAEKPGRVIFLADTRQLEAFPDADMAGRYANIVNDRRVRCTLVVIRETLYVSLMHTSVQPSDQPALVQFFYDTDVAFGEAATLLN